MDYERIEREIHVEAPPDVVFEAISTPEHVAAWWTDEAEFEATPGGTGGISCGDRSSADAKVVPLTVVEADPPRRFAFRWAYEEGQAADAANSLLVTFDLVPSGSGTLVRFAETGFRAKGLQGRALEEQYADHAKGWDRFLPSLGGYAGRLVAAQ